jgi:hypothetical protein
MSAAPGNVEAFNRFRNDQVIKNLMCDSISKPTLRSFQLISNKKFFAANLFILLLIVIDKR